MITAKEPNLLCLSPNFLQGWAGTGGGAGSGRILSIPPAHSTEPQRPGLHTSCPGLLAPLVPAKSQLGLGSQGLGVGRSVCEYAVCQGQGKAFAEASDRIL